MDSNYNYEEELMIKIAWYYYIENLTQQEIAKILGINRIKILRLLDKAKDSAELRSQAKATQIAYRSEANDESNPTNINLNESL